jgi:hypothetical protein
MSPMIPCHNCKQQDALVLCDIMCRIHSQERVTEAPEHVQLELGLDAKEEYIAREIGTLRREISFILVESEIAP